MSPSFSRGRSGGVYRYYVSASLQQGTGKSGDKVVRRLPAPAIEALVTDAANRWLPCQERALDHVQAIRIADGGLVFECPPKHADDIARHLRGGEQIIHSTAKICRIKIPVSLPLRGGQRLIIADDKPDVAADPKLIAALRRAHSLLGRDRKGMPIIDVSPPIAYNRNILRLAFLAPDIQRDIMEGRQPQALNLQQLIKMRIPISWKEQRKMLNWPASS